MASLCPIHNEEFKTIPAGISKAGKPYPAFMVCSHYGCKEKPNPNEQGQRAILDMSDPIDKAISQSPQRHEFETPKDVKPDWDSIAEGKVRHGVACAVIGQVGLVELTDEMIELMDQWVKWIISK